MKSYTEALVSVFCGLTQHSFCTGRNFSQGEPCVGKLLSTGTTGEHSVLFAELTLNIHNPKGQYTHSASLQIFAIDDSTGDQKRLMYLDLQALDADNPTVKGSGIMPFVWITQHSHDQEHAERCSSIITHVKAMLHAPGSP